MIKKSMTLHGEFNKTSYKISEHEWKPHMITIEVSEGDNRGFLWEDTLVIDRRDIDDWIKVLEIFKEE